MSFYSICQHGFVRHPGDNVAETLRPTARRRMPGVALMASIAPTE